VTLAISIALCLAVIGTLLNVHDWRVARQRSMAECPHRWVYASAWDEGRYWHRLCRNCPKQEIVPLEDVPQWWRRQERAAHAARAASRRDVWRGQAAAVRRLSRPAREAERWVTRHLRTRRPNAPS
jgi:hypothetical protein